MKNFVSSLRSSVGGLVDPSWCVGFPHQGVNGWWGESKDYGVAGGKTRRGLWFKGGETPRRVSIDERGM